MSREEYERLQDAKRRIRSIAALVRAEWRGERPRAHTSAPAFTPLETAWFKGPHKEVH